MHLVSVSLAFTVSRNCLEAGQYIACWTANSAISVSRYEENNGCLLNGNFPGSDLFGKTANEACCICGGGSFSGGVTYLELRNDAIPSDCLDLYGASTTNGNPIILYPCNGSPAQKWFVDGNYYIRSALDTNKCIVGSAGETSEGINLVINDCFANDTRFVLGYYDDKRFRPAIDTNLCVEPSYSETFDGWYVVQLSVCSDNASQQWTPYRASERRDLLTEDSNRSRDLQDECTDLPNAWYDIYGDNCAWYAAGTNCKDYGSQNKNFGKTANQACCVCGGGSSAERDMGDQQSAPVGVALNDAGCYDFDGFYDNVGDGCVWYAQGYNCEYYGSQFASERGTANEACCACGGGSPDPPALSDETLTPGCSNNPSNWVDKDGDNCAFYAIGSNCDDFGDDNFGVATKTARSACCACGGGISPNTQGTSDGIDSTITTTDETSAAPVSSTLPVYLSVSCLVFLFLFRFHLPIMG